jgi:hypothetical protein
MTLVLIALKQILVYHRRGIKNLGILPCRGGRAFVIEADDAAMFLGLKAKLLS